MSFSTRISDDQEIKATAHLLGEFFLLLIIFLLFSSDQFGVHLGVKWMLHIEPHDGIGAQVFDFQKLLTRPSFWHDRERLLFNSSGTSFVSDSTASSMALSRSTFGVSLPAFGLRAVR